MDEGPTGHDNRSYSFRFCLFVDFGDVARCGMSLARLRVGCALGARFSRQFPSCAPRFVTAIVLCIVLMMCLSAAMAWGPAVAGDIFLPSMILAVAPGGIAEMSITARAL